MLKKLIETIEILFGLIIKKFFHNGETSFGGRKKSGNDHLTRQPSALNFNLNA